MFQCKYCNFVSKYKLSVIQHCKTHTLSSPFIIKFLAPTPPLLYKCKKCNFVSKYKWNVRRHCKTHALFSPFFIKSPAPTPPLLPITCEHCGMRS